MTRFKTPIIILILGILPFWLFIGSVNTLHVDGALVADSRFNLIGLILGLIGAGMAFGALRDPRQRADKLRLGLILAAGLVCLAQIAHAVELI